MVHQEEVYSRKILTGIVDYLQKHKYRLNGILWKMRSPSRRRKYVMVTFIPNSLDSLNILYVLLRLKQIARNSEASQTQSKTIFPVCSKMAACNEEKNVRCLHLSSSRLERNISRTNKITYISALPSPCFGICVVLLQAR